MGGMGNLEWRLLYPFSDGSTCAYTVKVVGTVEIMKRLVADFESTEVDEDRAEAMQTLEYYVHKFDNAVDFLALRGVERILVPSLNSTVDIQQVRCYLLAGEKYT